MRRTQEPQMARISATEPQSTLISGRSDGHASIEDLTQSSLTSSSIQNCFHPVDEPVIVTKTEAIINAAKSWRAHIEKWSGLTGLEGTDTLIRRQGVDTLFSSTDYS